MNYGDLCTGLSAASVAWKPLGWRAQWFSEIEAFPCKLLKHHYPDVPNLGDMMNLETNKTFLNASIDVMVGGTPCQSFSLAGLRGGLSDKRGNLALQYCRLLIAKRPRWFVWENVPVAFTSFSNQAESKPVEGVGLENGRCITETADFATIITAFQECGYSVAWRVLDAQFFGVPQRRRRVFVIGYIGTWRAPAAVLFDGEGGRRDLKAGSKERENITGTLTARTKGGGFPGTDESLSGFIQPVHALTTNPYVDRGENANLIITPTLDASYGKNQGADNQHINAGGGLFVYPINQMTSKINRSNPQAGDPAGTLTKNGGSPLLVPGVRRLTPLECERLQGFPDNYTNVPGASNSTRYQSLGNSMAVPVMQWLGKRIDLVDNILK